MTAEVDRPTAAGVLRSVPDQTCPYLGLETDRATHFAYPSTAQRCHAGSRPVSIDHAKQARDCLTAEHVSCSRYHPPNGVPLQGGRLREAVAATTLERVRPVTDGGAAKPAHRFPRVRRIARALLVAAVIIGAGVVGVLVGSRVAAMVATNTSGTPSPVVSGGALESAVASATAPTATPSPSPSTTPEPSATPTDSLAPAPTPIIYIVKRDDILMNIAQTYGVTVAALAKANGIEDPNIIVVGQRLVIPQP
jgi:LysM repeat protein